MKRTCMYMFALALRFVSTTVVMTRYILLNGCSAFVQEESTTPWKMKDL